MQFELVWNIFDAGHVVIRLEKSPNVFCVFRAMEKLNFDR